jgi:DNA-binding Xre family transcriptional regulator
MSIDLAVIERSRAVFSALEDTASPKVSGIPEVPDILVCTFDDSTDAFRIVYHDHTSLTLERSELADVESRSVLAWDIDEFRRGVEVVLEDGSTTSFSAEFPRYLRDIGYRRKVDRKRGRSDLGERVATRVREIRRKRGWSVAELARQCEMAAPNVHRLESGKHVPTTQTLLRIAEALEVPLERLLRK